MRASKLTPFIHVYKRFIKPCALRGSRRKKSAQE